MISVAVLIFMGGCATKPVKDYEWERCELACGVDEVSAAREVSHSMIKGLGCTCYNGETLWIQEGGL